MKMETNADVKVKSQSSVLPGGSHNVVSTREFKQEDIKMEPNCDVKIESECSSSSLTFIPTGDANVPEFVDIKTEQTPFIKHEPEYSKVTSSKNNADED